MRYSKVFIHSILLFTMPALALYPHDIPSITIQNPETFQESLQNDHLLSYDNILKFLDDIENGELEKRCSEADLKKINRFLAYLAMQGMLPNEEEENAILESDTRELLQEGNNPYEYFFSLNQERDYIFVPSFLYDQGDIILCKSWFSKAWSRTRKYIRKHRKAFIIGTAVVAAVVVIGVVAAAASAGAAAAGAAANGSGKEEKDKSKEPNQQESASDLILSSDPLSAIDAINGDPLLNSVMKEQISSFKENVAHEQFFQSSSYEKSSLEDSGKVLGSIFAHDSLKNFTGPYSDYSPVSQEIRTTSLDFGHQEIDRTFSTDYASLYADPSFNADFTTLSYQLRGEKALESGHLNQAVYDLGRAIELDPTSPLPYLERGIAHFGLGQYERSLEDYHQYTSQVQTNDSLSFSDFSLGFAKGLPGGIYESGKGLCLFVFDLVGHPVQTGGQIWNAFTLLGSLAFSGQWAVLGEALVPEAYQLVREWDTLPSDVIRGERVAHVFGKYGSDIIIPGVVAKSLSSGVKGAKELSAVYKSLQTAEKTLLLESVAGLENGAKIGEIIQSSQATIALGDELGFSVREMVQLKQSGKLEGAIDNAFENLIAKSESDVLRTAINAQRHIKFTRDYLNKPTKEIQKSIASYEKQIAIHQEKIANPTNYYPDWDKLDPRHRQALIDKKWPSEVQLYTEQRDILQSILNERG